MKTKSILALSLALVLTLSAMTGCKKNEGGSTSSGTSSEASSEAPKELASGLLKDVHTKVKEAFGEDYIPSAAFDEVYLEEQLGITKDMVKEFVAEGPMISTHVDTFIGIEAVDGKAEEVEKKLTEFRQAQIDNTMQYPMNVPKIKASTVTRVDNYVFFMILGGYDEALEGEEELLKHYETEIKKATDAVSEILKK